MRSLVNADAEIPKKRLKIKELRGEVPKRVSPSKPKKKKKQIKGEKGANFAPFNFLQPQSVEMCVRREMCF